jgi:hypothetical protein
MKNLVVIFILTGWAFAGFAQDPVPTGVDPKNVIKFLPCNLDFNTVSIEYEGMVNARNSVTLEFGLPDEQSINGVYGIPFSHVKYAELGTMNIKAAYRHYTGSQMLPRGFYIEPYLKYQNLWGDGFYIGTDEQNNHYVSRAHLTLETLNAGFQIGAQFLIGKTLAIDFYFFGLEAGLASGDMWAISTDAPKFAQDIKKTISDLPSFMRNQITVTDFRNRVHVNANNVPYPWFRAGISIGLAF